MGQIYIVENKSLAAYLRQLAKMGEDPEDVYKRQLQYGTLLCG